jgi:eukaryotic-like serine/threonine-protein kinase
VSIPRTQVVTDKVDRFRQIEEICQAALDRPAADREAFLREACGDDADVRHEIEVVLANIARAEMFLEQPVAAVAAQVLEPSTDAVLTGVRLNGLAIGPLIGSGGMGQVYRAHDSDLHREVAVKVLLPEFARDADRLTRFAREGRVLATLNHPNIAQIHGLEKTDATTAIVMELVEGETLAERIARGPCSMSEALSIARQIAEALEAAHERGVIHRDLKPANAKVRPDGTVKVLDFGLAKSLHHPASQADERMISADPSTIPGMILGTAAYMAPEQVQQKPVDRRVDIWALGCVLFEMLTAQPAFAGETPSEVLSRIVEHDPNWEALPATTPPAIRRLLHRCLERSARHRLDSAAAARLEIEEAEREPASVVSTGGRGASKPSLWRPLMWTAFGALVAVVALIVATPPRPPERPRSLVATSVILEGPNLAQAGVHFAVAPSGGRVIYTGNYGSRSVLFRRDLDRVDPVPIVGSEGGSDVFFSHDGQSIGFETRTQLWTAPLDGGAPRLLVPNQPLRGGTWGEDDRIVVGRVGSGLWMASAAGGDARQLTVPQAGERHELPQLLPGGRAVLFTILSAKTPARAAVFSLETGDTRDLLEGIGARFVNSGHLVFGREGKLWAVAFDPVSLQTRGTARPIRDDVLWSAAGYPQFSIGGNLLAYLRSSHQPRNLGKHTLIVVNRRGKSQALSLNPDNYLLPRFAPAGDRFVVQVGAARDLWTYDLGRSTFTRLTSDRIVAYSAPAWTPDGRRVVFTTWFGGEMGLGWIPADGSGPAEVLVQGVGMRSFERTHPVILPDGSGVIMSGLAPGAAVEDLLIVPLANEKRLRTLWQGPGVERNPAIAHNGRFLAYNSDESGRHEIYVRPFPNVGARRWQISTNGGAFPVWTRGGREIIYMDGRSRIMAAAVRANGVDELDVSRPEPLFTFTGSAGNGFDREFDVTSDGERFLFLVSAGPPTSEARVELVLLQNWVEELIRLVPPERQ